MLPRRSAIGGRHPETEALALFLTALCPCFLLRRVTPDKGMGGLNIQRAALAEHRPSRTMSVIAALRLHHWSKNLLVFLPVVAGHRFSLDVLVRGALAFACFCAVASAGYLINDLLDHAADGQHPPKKDRAIASGALAREGALILAIVLAASGLFSAWLIGPGFALVAAIYLCGSVAYSTILKEQAIVDVVVLAALFTLRVIAGSEATAIVLSKWLLMLSLFLFLSLAVAKRCSEVARSVGSGSSMLLRRAYRPADLPTLSALGAAAGYAAALVLALYIASPEVRLLYSRPERLWLAIPFLIFWISRMQLLAARGEIDDDPITFAFTDRATWLAAACTALVFIAAI